MISRRHPLPDAEALDRPDVGFVAAAGVYVATVFVGASVSIALAIGGTASTVVGSVSSAVTIGLLIGAIGVDRTPGLAERLGYSRRLRGLLFVVPVLFVLATIGTLFVTTVPAVTAAGTGLGAALTGLAAAGLASMGRTRYARAIVSDEPIAQFRRLNPRQRRYWLATGVGCFGSGAMLLAAEGEPLQRGIWWLFAFGLYSFYVGFVLQGNVEDQGIGSESEPRRRILGAEYPPTLDPAPVTEMLPELHVHRTGVVLKRPLQRRFVPWVAISDVRLTDDELVLERDGWFDIRCDRAVIDDAEAVYEEIRLARAGAATVDRGDDP